jgi:CBS domain-containing protein
MKERVRDVMTPSPRTVSDRATVRDAAKVMRDDDIGALIVLDANGGLRGILTDRDLVVRGLAAGYEPDRAMVADVCSDHLMTLAPADALDTAVETMRRHGIRRVPVVKTGKIVGIVSLGDLAVRRDPDSALGQISSAPPNR